MNNSQFFKEIDYAKSQIALAEAHDTGEGDTWAVISYWFGSLASELLVDIRDRGGVYHLQAKKLLELLDA